MKKDGTLGFCPSWFRRRRPGDGTWRVEKVHRVEPRKLMLVTRSRLGDGRTERVRICTMCTLSSSPNPAPLQNRAERYQRMPALRELRKVVFSLPPFTIAYLRAWQETRSIYRSYTSTSYTSIAYSRHVNFNIRR